ncbi:MAG: VOC family protein [Acidimicrobiales bacterium]
MTDRISAAEFNEASGLEDWRLLWGGSWPCAHFRTATFESGVTLVQAIGEIANRLGRDPDVDLRADGVSVRLFGDRATGLGTRDLDLAREISLVARELAASADPGAVQHVQIAIDALHIEAVRPFWAAVLGYELVGGKHLVDPLRRGPTFWCQQMDAARPQRGRLHVDVYLAKDEVETRIAAALAAGGHMVNDENAPEWWTLADAEGNEVDLAIWEG